MSKLIPLLNKWMFFLLILISICDYLYSSEFLLLIMYSRWFPKAERARAVGIAMAGFQLGSAIGLVLSPILMSNAGVFGPFVIFGLFGFLWFVVWLSATSSIPERSRQISEYELNYILTMRQQPPSSVSGKMYKAKVIPPFKKLLSKPPTWSLMVANGMHSWVVILF